MLRAAHGELLVRVLFLTFDGGRCQQAYGFQKRRSKTRASAYVSLVKPQEEPSCGRAKMTGVSRLGWSSSEVILTLC